MRMRNLNRQWLAIIGLVVSACGGAAEDSANRAPASAPERPAVARLPRVGAGQTNVWRGPPDRPHLTSPDDGTPSAGPSVSSNWSRALGSAGDDFIAAIAVDASGTSYVAGSLAATVDLGCGAMSPTGSLDAFVVAYDSGGACLWSRHFGGTSEQWSTSLVLDGAGHILVSGVFSGTTDFGLGALASAGGYDGFIVRLSTSAGDPSWARAIGGAGDDSPSSVALAAGDVIVAGNFHGTANVGGPDLVSAGGSDAFLARYSATDGAHVWSLRQGGAGYDAFNSVATLDSTVVVSGTFVGTSNFGGSDLISAGSYDGVLAAYTFAGAHSWSHRFGGTGNDGAMSAIATPDGAIALSAWFSGTVDFSDGTGTALAATGSFAAAVVRYTSSGVFTWSTKIDATGLVYAPGIVADANGNIVVTGSFEGTATLPLIGAIAASGADDSFIARFDATGVGTWATTLAGSGSSEGIAIASPSANRVIVGGYFDTSIDLGGGSVTSAGGTDFWLKATATQ